LEFERHCAAREDGEAERRLDRFAEVDIGFPREGEAERRLDRFAEVDLKPPRDGEAERRLDRFAEVDLGPPRDGEAERRLDRFAEVDLGPPRDRNSERRLDRSEFERELAAREDGETVRRLDRFAAFRFARFARPPCLSGAPRSQVLISSSISATVAFDVRAFLRAASTKNIHILLINNFATLATTFSRLVVVTY